MTKTRFAFLDISIGGGNAGRMQFELFNDHLPLTSENFLQLCTGETGLGYYLRPRWYKNSPFHRIIPEFMCQGGDYNKGNGYGGESIYGQFFRDENFIYNHSKRGLLSMATTQMRNSNNSQFFITFNPCHWLDGKHVVFGQLTSGFDVLDKIEAQGTELGKPRKKVNISNCGELRHIDFSSSREKILIPQENTTLKNQARPSKNENYYTLEKSPFAQELARRSKINF